MKGPKKLAQYSFLGFKPKIIIKAKNGKIAIQNIKTDEEIRIKTKKPLKVIEELLKRRACNNNYKFSGGAVGYISYDIIRYWENIQKTAVDDLKFPDFQMGIYDDGVIFDHIQGKNFYYFREEDRSKELIDLSNHSDEVGSLTFKNLKINIKKEHYEKSVEKAKKYIRSGDIFQVVLSKRYDFKLEGDLTKFYLTLRRINPSPYMYFLKMGEKRIIGSSPEMLVRVDKRSVETFPIAGTRPLTKDLAKNKVLAKELISDPKERAEHIMLLDLARNDIGKVSKFGSVNVPEFMKVHQYSHVQHIVSRVVGKLKDKNSSYDAFRAVFPAGTVSGAPKIRAMEIIEESERTRRGPYAGAVGYFSYNGNLNFAITIRTLVANKNKCFIQVGGGIVADSIPEEEWFETEHKGKALMKALELSENQL
jgi:anthranilate synthase component 1